MWLDPSRPLRSKRHDGRAQGPDEEQGPPLDPLSHLPRPAIVRVREVRGDYEYHYE
jgi:hypothetical protein